MNLILVIHLLAKPMCCMVKMGMGTSDFEWHHSCFPVKGQFFGWNYGHNMEGKHTNSINISSLSEKWTLLIVELVSDLTVWTMIAPLVLKNRDFSWQYWTAQDSRNVLRFESYFDLLPEVCLCLPRDPGKIDIYLSNSHEDLCMF